MGNAFNKFINGPPFSPRCVPNCTPGPNNRGIVCYRGECVPDCPPQAIMKNGKCVCDKDFSFVNTSNNKNPLEGKGWGYCKPDKFISKEIRIDTRIKKLRRENPNMSEEELRVERDKIIEEEERNEEDYKMMQKKQLIRFKPESIFMDKIPEELDERVKEIVRKELDKKPNMSEEELLKIIGEATNKVLSQLSTECAKEYDLVETILSESYGNGRWPSNPESYGIPWPKGQEWPKEKDIISCKQLSIVYDHIKRANVCTYTDDYPEVSIECNVPCGEGTEIRRKGIQNYYNADFPTDDNCEEEDIQMFKCSKGECSEKCKYEVNLESFHDAKCSKPCDSGEGPGEKTYEVTFISGPKGDGTCPIKDWQNKKKGDKVIMTSKCNKKKCLPCEIETKTPYGNYKESVIDDQNKEIIYSKCLMNGKGNHLDCGGGIGGINYELGARTKYNVTYKITKNDDGNQTCTPGESIVEEKCPDFATTWGGKQIKVGGNSILGGGKMCPGTNSCEYVKDANGNEVLEKLGDCSAPCDGGKQKMRPIIVRGTRSAPICIYRDPNKYSKLVDCNQHGCHENCQYRDEDPKREQVNDDCPGLIGGKNEHIVYDIEKNEWYNKISKQTYPFFVQDVNGNDLKDKDSNKIATFRKNMRVPTVKPPTGKGTCHNTSDTRPVFVNCPTTVAKKPIHAQWGPWVETGLQGKSISSIGEIHSNWSVKKIEPNETNEKVGNEVSGSGKLTWTNTDNIYSIMEQVHNTFGHKLGESVIFIEKRNNKVYLYSSSGNKTLPSGKTWKLEGGEETNLNFGKIGTVCIDEQALGSSVADSPKRVFTRQIIKPKAHGGNDVIGSDTKREDYMYDEKTGKYKKYCPRDAKFAPNSWSDITEWNSEKCYIEGSSKNIRNKYTQKELDEESKRNFVVDFNLPKYEDLDRKGEPRIIGPGNRTIYRYKKRTTLKPYCDESGENCKSVKYGGIPSGKWYQKDEKYDFRNYEYDECPGVRELLKNI
tara:strand:- start:85 stop:3069 length:2985 start_codon:yes stop_codon:yes gene_type:complete